MREPTHPIPDAALASHLAILGKTGAGKSYAARSTVEQLLHGGGRACIVDPTGVWWGLRLAPDGKARSRFSAVIAGGRHADVPLAEGDGPALAKIVGTTDTPIILDVSAMTVSARTVFFTAFAEALLVENVGPLLVVLDEAHLFAPQTRVPDPRSAMMVHAANNLVALGRARGLRILLLSQRPAKLHKDSLTQVETLVAMRLVAPQDRKAVEDWIAGQAEKKQGADIIASLPGLRVGEAWIWSPAVGVLERATFPTIATFDSMRPEAQSVRTLPPVDIAAIRAVLATHEAAEPEYRRRSPRTNVRQAAAEEIAAAEQRGHERGKAEGLDEGREFAARVAREHLAGTRRALIEALDGLDGFLADLGRKEPLSATASSGRAQPALPAPQPTKRAVDTTRSAEAIADLNSAARKMLAVLDTNPPVRRSWRQVATLAGLKARGGHFNAGRKALLDQACVVEDGGLVAIRQPSTTARPEAIDTVALVEMWAGSLSGAAPRILRHLYGAAHDTRAGVAEVLSLQPRGGHWNAAWKELRDNGLIAEAGETVRLSDLFAEHDTRRGSGGGA